MQFQNDESESWSRVKELEVTIEELRKEIVTLQVQKEGQSSDGSELKENNEDDYQVV